MDMTLNEREIQKEAREEVVHRLTEGKGVLPAERKTEAVERLLAKQMTERAREGEHLPSSLHTT